jgi:hypothetical protein
LPFALALLLVLLLRAGLPDGFMVAPAPDGAARIVPCPGVAMPMHQDQHDPGAGHEIPCAFALVAPPAMPNGPIMVSPLPPPAQVYAAVARHGAIPPAATKLGPPATGPPAA